MGVAAPSPFPVTFSGSLVSPFRADGSEGRGWGRARRGESASRAPIPLHLPRGGEPCGQLPPAPLWLCVGRRRLGWGRGAGESLAGAPVFLPPVRGSSRGIADSSLPGILLSLPGHPHARRWGGRKSKRLVGAGDWGGVASQLLSCLRMPFSGLLKSSFRALISRWLPSLYLIAHLPRNRLENSGFQTSKREISAF